MIVLVWAGLVAAATVAMIVRDREGAWWLDELAELEVEAHARAIPVAVAGVHDERKLLGTEGTHDGDAIRFVSTGFTMLTDQDWITIAPQERVVLIAQAARIYGDAVTVPGGTELLLYSRIRSPRRRPHREHDTHRLALLRGDHGTVIAERGVRFLTPGGATDRLARRRLAFWLVLATQVGVRAVIGSPAWMMILMLGTVVLALDAWRGFPRTWSLVWGGTRWREWEAALQRARTRR